MAVPFKLEAIEEYVGSNQVKVTWTTVADDGEPLTESDVFTYRTDVALEGQVTAWLKQKRAMRAKLNNLDRPVEKKKRVKRSTALLDLDRLQRGIK